MSPNDIYYEYNTMMNILSHYDNDKIIDHLRVKIIYELRLNLKTVLLRHMVILTKINPALHQHLKPF